MINRLRLISGLVLLVFVTHHLLNHAVGLISIAAQDAVRVVHVAVWSSAVGTTVLVAALLVHFALALRAVYVRRSLRMAGWEWAQLALGFAIPIILVEHILGTRVSEELFDMEPSYAFVQAAYWVLSPWDGVLQVTLLIIAWLHGCIGVHYWLSLKPWYRRALPMLYGGALLVPALALGGLLSAGVEVARLADDPAWIGAMLRDIRYDREASVLVGEATPIARWTLVGLIAAAFVGRWIRLAVERRRGVPELHYPGGRRVAIPAGATVLETSRGAGIPHAAVCGGRGRCSTCRVRIGRGADHLPPPEPSEARVLARIGAPPTVRLACQIRPAETLEVTPLLPSTATARDGFRRPGYLAGQERDIAILFADLRGFTRWSDGKLPFDVVYLLNRYFQAMGSAIENAGGRVDKFLGDGVMALFGLDSGSPRGCRQALTAAQGMAVELTHLNAGLGADLAEPLRMGIGIHVGPVIVGEMGHGTAKSLTAIGDPVNVASRLEGLSKEFAVQLVLSDDVARTADVDLSAFERRRIDVRGKDQPVSVRLVPDSRELPLGG